MSDARDALLGRAIAHYAAHGIRDTSLRSLASAIGTSQRMLHYHFGSREDLLAAVLDAVAGSQAKQIGVNLQRGVYVGLAGPTYETKAEVHMLKVLGGHAVGMSTVNEVIAANDAGMRVLGCSLITNVHRVGGTPTTHQEVMDEGKAAGPRLASVLRAWLPTLGE